MRLITKDDFRETLSKIYQKKISFWLSRLSPKALDRTKGTFAEADEDGSYWWMIPAVRKRMNKLATGDEDTLYEHYFCGKYLAGKTELKVLSLGCGTATHEMRLAGTEHFSEIVCVDIAEKVLSNAAKEAKSCGLNNIRFEVCNVNEIELPPEYYDMVLFHSSLHHFESVDTLVNEKIGNTLKKDGYLVINEYVGANRLQYPARQIKAMNSMLSVIPEMYRKRYKSQLTKRSITGPGLLRMLITDPSECVESDRILPAIRQGFHTVEEKSLGGNLLMLVYKDIAHHFLKENSETAEILKKTFAIEDSYLQKEKSDFVFGIYSKK